MGLYPYTFSPFVCRATFPQNCGVSLPQLSRRPYMKEGKEKISPVGGWVYWGWRARPPADILRAMIHTAMRLSSVPRRADSPATFRAFFGRRRLRGSISATAVNALASAIQTHEGYFPGSVAYANNNPGNLVYVGQAGALPGAGGFARFSSYDAGLTALKNQITLDASRGADAAGHPINTVSDLIASWAPSSDPRNNTPAYIAAVANDTGFDPSAPLSSLGVPTFSVDVYGSGIDATGSPGDSLPSGYQFDPGMSAGGSGLDLGATVDLSSVGLSSSVPWWWLGLGALAAVVVARRV